MFDIAFRITNPWSERFNCLFVKLWKISNNKNLEIIIYRSNSIVNFCTKLYLNCNHAGFYLTLGLFGYDLEFNIYNSDRMMKEETEEDIIGIG